MMRIPTGNAVEVHVGEDAYGPVKYFRYDYKDGSGLWTYFNGIKVAAETEKKLEKQYQALIMEANDNDKLTSEEYNEVEFIFRTLGHYSAKQISLLNKLKKMVI